jgi:hypothetical protein
MNDPFFADVIAERRARDREVQADRLYDGLAFADEVARAGPAVWGEGEQVLWSPQEPLMIYAPQGVGKTTLAQRLTLGRVGVEPMVLRYRVAVSDKPVLYVAADRPAQAARSWRRMVANLTEAQRALVRERVKFWRGPLPFDIGADPDRLLDFVLKLEVGTFVADSLKDLAMDLTKDETGGRVNRAWQLLIANEIEVADLHHPRKSLAGQSTKPKSLDDVYGSTWLTVGHGSIVLLWGNAGDPIVELSHLKQPLEEVGPFRVIIDHELGMLEIHDGADPLAILRAAKKGMAARDAATVLFSTSKPTDSEVEKARRRLEKLVARGFVFANRSGKDDLGHPIPVTYFVAERQGRLS